MREAVVIDAIRTPTGKASADSGIFRDVRADELSAGLMRQLVDRTGIEPALIEDVRWGCVQQQGEQGFDIARIALLMADLPIETGGVTVNRNCASSLQAINQASHAIMAGFEDVQIVGGLEHMQHLPMDAGINLNPKLFHRTSKGALAMGVTAEFLAQTQGIHAKSKTSSRCVAINWPPRRRPMASSSARCCQFTGATKRASGSSSISTSACAPTPAWKRWAA